MRNFLFSFSLLFISKAIAVDPVTSKDEGTNLLEVQQAEKSYRGFCRSSTSMKERALDDDAEAYKIIVKTVDLESLFVLTIFPAAEDYFLPKYIGQIDGVDLSKFNDVNNTSWDTIAYHLRLFSRVAPNAKYLKLGSLSYKGYSYEEIIWLARTFFRKLRCCEMKPTWLKLNFIDNVRIYFIHST